MSGKFLGKIVLVTGAASGIGKQTALLLASEGAKVWCADINEDGMNDTIADIKAAGGTANGTTYNATIAKDAQQLIKTVIEAHGKLDILCNIAGSVRIVKTTDETPELWDKTMAINANGPFYLSSAALPHLLKSKGNIIFLASVAGLMGQAYTAAYCASKHAVIGLAKSLALEFGRSGLRSNCICPGAVDTPLLKNISLPDDIDFDLLSRYNFSGDATTPEDVAKLISHIASDDSSFINGAQITIDGGTTAG